CYRPTTLERARSRACRSATECERRCGLLLPATQPIRTLDFDRGQPMVLAANRRRHGRDLATVLGPRSLGEHGQRLVLGIRLSMGMGGLPLRSLAPPSSPRLDLVAGPGLGAGLGDLANRWGLCRLGAAPAWHRHCRFR